MDDGRGEIRIQELSSIRASLDLYLIRVALLAFIYQTKLPAHEIRYYSNAFKYNLILWFYLRNKISYYYRNNSNDDGNVILVNDVSY